MLENGEKRCRRCERDLPLTMFWKCARYDDGLNRVCKDCLAPNPEQRERQRVAANEYRRRNPERHEANKRSYYQRNPEKRAAKNAVYYALKNGVLTREPCEVCGDENSQAHHDDYSRKLDVRWLCTTHHVDVDMERRADAFHA